MFYVIFILDTRLIGAVGHMHLWISIQQVVSDNYCKNMFGFFWQRMITRDKYAGWTPNHSLSF